MKKVYQINKIVLADNIEDAIKKEKKAEIIEIYVTKHSSDLILDSLHSKNK